MSKTLFHESEMAKAAVAAFSAIHAQDPAGRGDSGQTPAEIYHAALARWVERIMVPMSESIWLAARCQHLRRWAIARDSFPEGRAGYRTWRTTLQRAHANEAATILGTCGYGPEVIDRVRDILTKARLKADPEVQLFEDAICLVFLETALAAFARKHDRDKLTGVLQKTWKKMSVVGHAAALELVETLDDALKELVTTAVASSG